MWIESKIPVTSIISKGLPGNSREKYRYQTNVVLAPSHIRWWVEQLPGPCEFTILDYVKMLPEIMHQSLDFGPFSAYGSIGALC